MCEPYVWEDPRYLFRFLSGRRGVCASELINDILLTYVLALLIGLILGFVMPVVSLTTLAFVGATMYLLPSFKQLQAIYQVKENFKNQNGTTDITVDLPSDLAFPTIPSNMNNTGAPGNPLTTEFQNALGPSARNPFDNVLIDQIKYNPTRAAAPDITTRARRVDLDDFFRVQWYSDPTDVFGKTQSQRMFVSQPSTTVPNDQGSYQDWLYKIPGKTCKEGNPEACYGGTNGAQMPWLNL